MPTPAGQHVAAEAATPETEVVASLKLFGLLLRTFTAA
ncbi:hypothetical protein RvY_13850 [Ramazzottius varieornatus]|uniref:Uncharacterized protein n=1 Tax=Ramazzottius varieornatus TaxID=947166 RepID=A0A1D1VPC2_RAMVA|nr:hypothetical protein RvY_13850 [Ramazzottius varieornatus]